MKSNFNILFLFLVFLCSCQNSKQLPPIQFSFENTTEGWKSLPDANVSLSGETMHDGSYALKISGAVQSGLWNFAESDKIPIESGKRYKFVGWMRIDSLGDGISFFKFVLYQKGHWVKSINSSYYDIKRRGEWQQLNCNFVAPDGDDCVVVFAIGKQDKDKNVYGKIYIDDMLLEKAE